MEHLDFAAQGLQPEGLSVVDEPRQPPPGIDAIQGPRALEYGLGGVRDGRGEEAAERRVEDHRLFLVELLEHGLAEGLGVDLPQFARFRPLENLLEDWGAADEVSFDLPLPSQPAPGAVEAVVLLEGQLFVEDGAILEGDGAERAFEIERKTLARGRSGMAVRSCRLRPPGIAARGARPPADLSGARGWPRSISHKRRKDRDCSFELLNVDAVALAVAADDRLQELWRERVSLLRGLCRASWCAGGALKTLWNAWWRGSLP